MGFALTLVYVVLVFLRPQDLNPEWAEYQIMDVVGGLAIAGTVLSVVIGARASLRGPEWVLGVAFLLWSAFSVAAAIRWFGGAAMTLYALSLSFFTFMLVLMNMTTRRRLAVVVSLVCFSLLLVLLQASRAYYSDADASPFFIVTASRGPIDTMVDSPWDVVAPEEPSEEEGKVPTVKRIRGLGFLGDPNDLAQAFVSIMPLPFLAWRRRRLVGNLLLVIGPSVALVWGVLLTRSRGGLIALIVLALAALLDRLPPRHRHAATWVAVLSAIPAFVALFGYAKADSSASARLEAWAAGLLMLKWSPIWGVGSGLFTDHHNRVAHNSYVQCFAETGLVGYFLWLGLIVVTLQGLSRLAETAADPTLARWARALRLSMLAFLAAALFLSRTTSPMFFVLVSLPAVLFGIARRDGESVPVPGRWWLDTLFIEAATITLVWITARAYY